MLGSMVRRYLSDVGCVVLEVSERFSPQKGLKFVAAIRDLSPEWCVNCIAVRPAEAKNVSEVWATNSLLPQYCSVYLPDSIGVIHASTNGVFGPHHTGCTIYDTPDAVDLYGWSKRLAEVGMTGRRRYTIRCSIIGLESGPPRSLMSKILAEKGEIKGFLNHYWNGVTTLEWAKQCHAIIRSEGNSPPLIQPGFWPPVTKLEVVRNIVTILGDNKVVVEVEAPQAERRTLVPTHSVKSIDEQLKDFATYIRGGTAKREI